MKDVIIILDENNPIVLDDIFSGKTPVRFIKINKEKADALIVFLNEEKKQKEVNYYDLFKKFM